MKEKQHSGRWECVPSLGEENERRVQKSKSKAATLESDDQNEGNLHLYMSSAKMLQGHGKSASLVQQQIATES